MTPRIDVVAFDARRPVEELARMFSESKYSRIPIYTESIDRITGIVHVKDLFDVVLHHEEKTVSELARPPYFVSETKKVSELLRELQSEHLQIAVVVDEYGGTAGLVTIEDVLEEIVGEITDEYDVEHVDVEHLANGSTRVSSRSAARYSGSRSCTSSHRRYNPRLATSPPSKAASSPSSGSRSSHPAILGAAFLGE